MLLSLIQRTYTLSSFQAAFFDVPLHHNFYLASQHGPRYDLRTVLNNTLAKVRPHDAVTFVDNHEYVLEIPLPFPSSLLVVQHGKPRKGCIRIPSLTYFSLPLQAPGQTLESWVRDSAAGVRSLIIYMLSGQLQLQDSGIRVDFITRGRISVSTLPIHGVDTDMIFIAPQLCVLWRPLSELTLL